MPDYYADHAAASAWARNLLDEAAKDPKGWLIWDNETTGIPGDSTEIVQIGLLWADGTTALDTLVHPCFHGMPCEPGIPAEATRIHGITDAMVNAPGVPTLTELLPKLSELMWGRKIVIYNRAYDFDILLHGLYRLFYRETHEAFMEPIADVAALPEIPALSSSRYSVDARTYAYNWLNNAASYECAMEMYAQWVGEWNSYRGSYRWQRLPGGDHSAIGDCRACLDVIRRMAGDREI